VSNTLELIKQMTTQIQNIEIKHAENYTIFSKSYELRKTTGRGKRNFCTDCKYTVEGKMFAFFLERRWWDFVWNVDSGRSKEPCLRRKSRSPQVRGQFWGYLAHWKALWSVGYSIWGLRKTVSCAKTGRLILTIYTLYDVFLCKQAPFGGRGVTKSPKTSLLGRE